VAANVGSLSVTEIATARGPVASSELGRTLMHEHVFVLTADVQQNYPGEWDEERQVASAIEKLTALKAAGIDTIVDPTVVGLGRYIPRIARIAEQVDLNIVVATGIYTYDDVPNFFRMRGPVMGFDLPEPMVELFVRDLTVGIADTGVRAAFLKCAIDVPGMTPGVERVLRAVAKANLQTGAPVMVHTAPHHHSGLAVHEVLVAEGVDPHAVLLAHSGDSSDADHLSALADLGYLLGMDRFGLDLLAPFEERVGIVVELAARGYAEQMVLAHDAACYIDWVDPTLLPFVPNWHYLHISNDVLPALRDRGVTDAQIETMLVDNPRRWFERR
jgi:phosphotriesterase-related protein